MKAPDKIYLQPCGDCQPSDECKDCNCTNISGATWCEDRIFPTDIEYLRKDALVGWLEEMIEAHTPIDESISSTATWGQCNGFKQVLDKVKSM